MLYTAVKNVNMNRNEQGLRIMQNPRFSTPPEHGRTQYSSGLLFRSE